MMRLLKLFVIFICLANLTYATEGQKVVVIGGGIAGLTTAYRLHEEGVDVELFEAKKRIGGRIFSVKLNDEIGELGGYNLYDGGEAENILQLINEFDLEVEEKAFYSSHSYFDGTKLIPKCQLITDIRLDPEELQKKLDEAVQTSDNLGEVLAQIVGRDTPLYEDIAVRIAAYEGGSIENLSTLYVGTLKRMLLRAFACKEGEEPIKQGEFLSVKGGNSLLTEKIASALGEHLHLNMALTKVERREGSYQLTFANGQKVSADILVLALPCSSYKNISFEEGIIPKVRLEEIQRIRYGENAKILMPLPCNVTKKQGITSKEVICFFAVPSHHATLYYTGKSSDFSKDSIEKRYLAPKEIVELGLGKECFSNEKPLYAEERNFASYLAPVGYSWPNDPYIGGSYAYISPGQEEFFSAFVEVEGEEYKKLFAPLDNLYFAGEHTTILEGVPGTIEAACESGERVARAILSNVKSEG